MRDLVKRFFRNMRKKRQIGSQRMVLHTEAYRDRNGSFDYNRYKSIQQNGNKAKIDNVWVIEENICFLAEYIKRICTPYFGICHGTRRGKEQEWFKKHLGCDVIGTEISNTALEFANTIQWDFHDVKPEWLGAVDFIYSNSFDHSYDPEACLNAWMSCLKPNGVCIIEHTSGHEPSGANELDPFGAEIEIMPFLVVRWGKGHYAVKDIIEAPCTPPGIQNAHFLIISRV